MSPKKIIFVLCLFFLLTTKIYSDEFFDKMYYQRDLFERSFHNADINFSENTEINYVYNLDFKISTYEDIVEFLNKYNLLFGFDNVDCKIIFAKRAGTTDLTVISYKKYCNNLEVLQDKVSLFINKNTIFGVKNSMRNAQAVRKDFIFNENVIREKFISSKINVIGIKKAFFRFNRSLIPIYLIKGYEQIFLKTYYYYVNASSGNILFKVPLYRTIKGNVYIDSPEKDKSPTTVDLPETTEYGLLKNLVADVYSNCESGTGCDISKRLSKPDMSGNYLFNPDESDSEDPFAEVMAYYHLNRLYNWFLSSQFVFNPFGVTAIVNFLGVGSEYDEMFQCNGFYLERQVILGFCPQNNQYNSSKQNINIAYDADVIMHEMTHGFYDELYELNPVIDSIGFNGMLYGLNEAIADFIPSHITDDHLIGRHFGKVINQNGLRDLQLVRKCPYDLNGEPHNDGEIISTALWGARKLVSDKDLFAKTVFLSLGGLDASSSFKDFYDNLLRFVEQTEGREWSDTIKKPFLDRDIERCSRFIEVENGYTASGYLFPSVDIGVSNEVPYQVQFIYDLPEENNIVNVDITAANYSGSPSTDYVKFYVNHNRPVNYSFESMKSDYVWVKRTQTLTDLKQGKYYILPVGDGKGYYYFKIRFAYKEPAPVVDSVNPDEIKINTTLSEFEIIGKNFHPDAKIKLPYGITYEDYEVYDSNTIYVYNLNISKDTTCGYSSVSVINPDGQRGVGRLMLLISKGNEKCKCDITYECDEYCKCDTDCSDGGCSCSLIY